MFLILLNENEKKSFLELAEIITHCDGDNCETEKSLVLRYKKDLELEDYETRGLQLDQVVLELEKSSTRSKTIIYMELLGLALFDGDYDEEEKRLLKAIQQEFNFSNEKATRIEKWLFETKRLYELGNQLINE